MEMLNNWMELVCAEIGRQREEGVKNENGVVEHLTDKELAETKMAMLEPVDKMKTQDLVRLILGVRKGEHGKWAVLARDLTRRLETPGMFEPLAEDPLPLKAIWELSKRFTGKKLNVYLKPRDVWEELRDVRGLKKEHFMAFFLDTRNQEIRRETISVGTLNYNLVHPREVFEPAVKNLAAGIIVAHNHPSGCLEPSDEDLSLTKRLTQAGKLLGIELLDHVIVTRDGFMSFKQKGLI